MSLPTATDWRQGRVAGAVETFNAGHDLLAEIDGLLLERSKVTNAERVDRLLDGLEHQHPWRGNCGCGEVGYEFEYVYADGSRAWWAHAERDCAVPRVGPTYGRDGGTYEMTGYGGQTAWTIPLGELDLSVEEWFWATSHAERDRLLAEASRRDRGGVRPLGLVGGGVDPVTRPRRTRRPAASTPITRAVEAVAQEALF